MTPKMTALRVGVIMAGGSGERFWPLSRQHLPKQLLALTHPDKSMLSLAIEPIAELVGLNNVYIITGKHLAAPIHEAEPYFPYENILAEPCKRNTAGALAYTAAWLMARYPDRNPDAITLAVTTADHRIGDAEGFKLMLETAMNMAEQRNALVTCGIPPTRPETGFGYVEAIMDEPVAFESGKTSPVYQVRAFHEKPDAEQADRFVASGRHYWNSGMFFWKLSVFLGELRRARPALAEAVVTMAEALKRDDTAIVERIFEAIEGISIDYALMEKSNNVLMVRGEFPWADVGAWNAVDSSGTSDSSGNRTIGDPVVVDCANCIVYNAAGANKMAVGVVGMEDAIVVVTDDAVLVMPQSRAQDVRAVVEELKHRNAKQI
ncbi:MAG: Alginate biosynthesis protein AlgA [Candidatus Hydrogenedentes bacterium ADurb.Bin179]|nr:MAG: Alginate biosynthesis protein AlgA [Candidatus Hydrogenedentes bacterium ADurb.Bin179]